VIVPVLGGATVRFTMAGAPSLIQSYQSTEHLLLVYLLPTIFIAIYFGSTVAVLTSLASGWLTTAARPYIATF
jgi:hypothetical protein